MKTPAPSLSEPLFFLLELLRGSPNLRFRFFFAIAGGEERERERGEELHSDIAVV
jgi:hypothetical protein